MTRLFSQTRILFLFHAPTAASGFAVLAKRPIPSGACSSLSRAGISARSSRESLFIVDAPILSNQMHITMADLTFTITSRTGTKAHGTLAWPAKALSAPVVSGDSNHESINLGTWVAQRAYLLDKDSSTPYCDVSGGSTPRGHCWFQKLDDQFGRTEIGVHPDGGTPDATAGCIGLKIQNTKPWYDAFASVASGTSVTIEVKDA